MARKTRMACHANPSPHHSQIHSLMFWPSLRFFRWRFSKKPSDFLLTAVVLFCQRNAGRVGCLLRTICPTRGGSADTGMTGGWGEISLGGAGVGLVGFMHAGRPWSGGRRNDRRMLPQTAYSTTGGSGRTSSGRSIFEGGGRCESRAGGKSRCGRTQNANIVYSPEIPAAQSKRRNRHRRRQASLGIAWKMKSFGV